jgi:DNA replication initiation complex subunit (GINS family)
MQLSEIKLRHRETLVDLTYQTLLNRPADPERMQTFLNRLVKDEMLISIISNFINSEEYKIINSLHQSIGAPTQARFDADIADLSSLTPHARRIYADLKKAIEMKKGEVSA